MKECIWIIAGVVSFVQVTFGQGTFDFTSIAAPTHVGSLDGPLAGAGIWAQMFAGSEMNSLTPVGAPAAHIVRNGVPTGIVLGGTVAVPGLLPGETALVRMVAWDGAIWGASLSGVPADQTGMTDIVPIILSGKLGTPPLIPLFAQPAIVPIPEPGILALCFSGGFGLCFIRRARYL